LIEPLLLSLLLLLLLLLLVVVVVVVVVPLKGWKGGRVQIFGNNVNKSKFYSGTN
jgi:hypothetical protein